MQASSRLLSRRLGQPHITLLNRRRYWTLPKQSSVPYDAPKVLSGRRNKSTETGNNKSGHIEAGNDEGIFFLDSIFPLNLNFLLGGLPLVNFDKLLMRLMQSLQNPDIAAAEPEKIAKRALQTALPIEVTEILPRIKEGGAFVKFVHEPGQDLKEIEKSVRKYLKENPIRPWFNPSRRVKTFLVNGRPWIEDLYRIPNPRVKVEFVPPWPGQPAEELSQETLYSLFRRYGKLREITPQPTDSKDLPKFAFLHFNTVRHAIRAKNCMHGFILSAHEGGGHSGTMLKLSYDQKLKAHHMWDWLVNHPRLVIPVFIAFFGSLTVMVFDP